MSKELIPCKHCGSATARFERWVITDDAEVLYRVLCGACGYTPDHWEEIPKNAAEYWNTRPIEDALREKVEKLEAALHKIAGWADAYPLEVFPEPDWNFIDILLLNGGQRLSCVSAANMRHVVEGVGKIARDALKESEG